MSVGIYVNFPLFLSSFAQIISDGFYKTFAIFFMKLRSTLTQMFHNC